MATTTLSLSPVERERIKKLTGTFGGSVAGFCGAWGSLVSRLPATEILELRKNVERMVAVYESHARDVGAREDHAQRVAS